MKNVFDQKSMAHEGDGLVNLPTIKKSLNSEQK